MVDMEGMDGMDDGMGGMDDDEDDMQFQSEDEI